MLSRLNAQTVFLDSGSPVDICSLLSSKLHYDDDALEVSTDEFKHISSYNESVEKLFGDFRKEQSKGDGELYGLVECCANWGYTAE